MWSINGINYNNNDNNNSVVIDVATQLGYDIPRFRYHEGPKVAGNCRMCLVEDIKAAKPVVSCAMSITNNLEVFLNTTRVKKARESVMEFLLINHPLDCPICDQGGECDSQDLAMVYGSDHGRFYEYKRNVEDKNLGPIVKTSMNRCILCTRCVRFAVDVANINSFGITGRGMKSEIGSYVESVLNTDLSGNLVDICPVGALTSKPYSFMARPWELKRLMTINILDDAAQLIRADIKENTLLRVMPAKNTVKLNNWITNRVRYSYEGITRARNSSVLLFGKISQWDYVFNSISKFFYQLFNDFNVNTALALKVFDFTLANQDLKIIKSFINASASFYCSNAGDNNLMFLNKTFDYYYATDNTTLLFVNLDLQFTAPLLHLQIKQRFDNNISIFSWYSKYEFGSNFLFGSLTSLLRTLRLKTWHALLDNSGHNFLLFAGTKMYSLLKRFNPILIYSSSFDRSKGVYLDTIKTNFQNQKNAKVFSFYTIGTSLYSNFSPFSIKQTTHGDNFLDKSSIVLPSLTFFEQSNLEYFDVNYQVQKTNRIVVNNFARPTQSIVNAISIVLGVNGLNSTKNAVGDNYVSKNRFSFFPFSFNFKNKLTNFTIMSKKLYYSQYSLVKHAPSLKYVENKSIYQ